MSDGPYKRAGRPALEEGLEGNAERVLRYVVEHPGCYLRQIRRALAISMGTTQYHLGLLEGSAKVTSSKRGLYRYYFAARTFQPTEKSLLEVLSQETSREILMLIMERGDPTQSDIADKIGVSAPSVSWHVKRLVESDVITEARDGKYKRYHLRRDPQQLVSLMKNYYPSLWDMWSDRLAEIFLSFSRDQKKEP